MKTRICILLVFILLLTAAAILCAREISLDAMEQGPGEPVYVIDAGHGGEDGGAVSPDGSRESEINLAISRRVELLLGLFDCPCVMTRDKEILEYPTDANTVRKRKQADLERRADLVNGIPNAVLVSTHQNKYPSQKPSGAQVFCKEDIHSRRIAEYTQKQLAAGLSDPVRELSVISDDIYLMRNAKCPAILVECGFLSNPRESALLRSESYQTRLALCIACACAEYTKEWEKEYGQGSKG